MAASHEQVPAAIPATPAAGQAASPGLQDVQSAGVLVGHPAGLLPRLQQGRPWRRVRRRGLRQIKHFKLVTLEKWQGSAVTPYMWEEDAWVVAAKQIKAVNPDVSVVVWLDSFRIYTANKTLNPDLGAVYCFGLGLPRPTPALRRSAPHLRLIVLSSTAAAISPIHTFAPFLCAGKSCTTGHYRAGVYPELHPDMLLKNTSGKPALEPWSKCHIYDFEKEYVRQYWTDVCLNMTDSGVIDGCGADASWQVDPTGGTTDPATMTGWDIGHRTMMRDTTLALGGGVGRTLA